MSIESISRIEKEKFLLSLDEDRFREAVVRRLFYRLGLKDGRDLCGPEEHGKDALFYSLDLMGEKEYVAVQTKVGNINLSGKATTNLLDITAQLRTARESPYVCVSTRTKIFVSKVYLIASGRINAHARERIVESIKDVGIKFLDRDDLITKIDETCPEIWLDIDAELSPYLQALEKRVEDQAVISNDAGMVFGAQGGFLAAADESYIDVKLICPSTKREQVNGRWKDSFDLKEIRGSGLAKLSASKILVLGEAGSGKSTLLIRLAYLLAKQERSRLSRTYRVPVPVRARDILEAKSEEFLIACARSVQRQTGLSKSPFSLDDAKAGRLFLLVDALDEVLGDSNRRTVIQRLNEFHAQYPKCCVIVTARAYGSIERIGEIASYERYRISAIGIKEAEKIVRRVNKTGIDDGKSRELLRKIDNIHGIDLNPLLVTVFALIAEADKRDIPANITELFNKFTELMLGRWDQEKGLSLQYQEKMKEHLLGRFTFELHRGRKTRFSLEQFRGFAEQYLSQINALKDLEPVVHETIERSGLFRDQDGELEYRHHLLQEFFAAKGLPNLDFIKSVIAEDWWRNSIVFYFGSNPERVEDLLDVATSNYSASCDAYIAIGLALQTCYLSPLQDRIDVWKHVVETAAHATQDIFSRGDEEQYPLSDFLMHYLAARDAVALGGIENVDESVMRWATEGNGFAFGNPEIRRFWYLAALVEIGSVELVRRYIQKSPLKDNRLNLALHLGCFFFQKVRTATRERKQEAAEITKMLSTKIAYHQALLAKEFRGQLLELRRGKIVALDEEEYMGESERLD
ncbi:NACHT domain-containing protein [Dokdonella fugitiva]|jgi:hypothetical protein|uniref:NACHT domain-containing protein n=1 Tax=Dokdonella fugitiva TaxID=328517 RepID=UPI0015F996A0|nr:NACHT domain-containing protein [Dokdonella fugitiva]MBA8882268.1 hypothetical protein [Dokdonella fugitiva]